MFKYLIDYLLTGDEKSFNELDEQYKRNVKRIIGNLFYKNLKAMYLFNKYVNNYDKMNDPDYVIKFAREIIKRLNINRNSLHFIKDTNLPIKEQIFKSINDPTIPDISKSFIFTLYQYGVISNDNIKITNNYSLYSGINDDLNNLYEESVKKYYKTKYIENIKSGDALSNYITSILEDNTYCRTCPLNRPNKKTVILDSNINDINSIDVVFLGINPGEEEVKQNKPFVGKSGKILRKYIDEYLDNVGYLITNVILCHTKNQNDLKHFDISKITSNCQYYREIVDIIKPKLIVGFGDIVMRSLGISGKITEIAGQILTYDNNIKLILLPHPSSYLRNKSKIEPIWNSVFPIIKSLINDKITNNFVINEIYDISQLPDNETLFDISVLEDENKYLIILIDENGNKKYYKLPFSTYVYINPDVNPRNCDYMMNKDKLIKYVIDDYNEYQRLRNLKNKEFSKIITGS